MGQIGNDILTSICMINAAKRDELAVQSSPRLLQTGAGRRSFGRHYHYVPIDFRASEVHLRMNKVADVLKRFNRKERNLLVRAVLGDEQKPLLLSDQFRKDIANKLGMGIEILPDAWWATDYHINWLAGALAYYAESDACLNRARRNSASSEHSSSGQMIEQNQEDVDLIIVSDHDLILIEAKAYGYFDNPQLESKLERLNLVRNEYLCITKQNPVVQMHFLLISPTEPKKIKVTWPEWTWKESEIPWIPLHLPSGEPILKVNRCDADANELAEGDHWRIVKY